MNFTGQHLRQLRREQNITQTALGGNRYSKSYVSAVEKGRISPSSDALRYFAEQLGQPTDYFFTLLNESERDRTVAQLDAPGSLRLNGAAAISEEFPFLDMLLQHAELHDLSSLSEWDGLSPETLSQLSPENQGNYYFVQGLIRQRDARYAASIMPLEAALTLSPAKRHTAILDELGVSYYHLRDYQTALGYHKRALDTLNNDHSNGGHSAAGFKIELHCANDYLALSGYQQAYAHFEQARSHLNAQNDMQSAGSLYWGLGYSAYALAYQLAMLVAPENTGEMQAIEQRYQHAISFLLQSRSIYQISGDREEEDRVRLALIMASLDLSAFHSIFFQKSSAPGKAGASFLPTRMNSLLQDAAEQCRQIIMNWKEIPDTATLLSPDDTTTISFALAYIVRILVRQAANARASGNASTAYRERTMAAYLCEQTLDALKEGKFTEQLARKAETLLLPEEPAAFQFSALPRLPTDAERETMSWCTPASLGEIFFAAGQVAEEFGRAATNPDYASDCYAHSDEFFKTALDLSRKAETALGQDAGQLLRVYHRCIAILEERMALYPDQDTNEQQALLHILTRALFHLQSQFFLVTR